MNAARGNTWVWFLLSGVCDFLAISILLFYDELTRYNDLSDIHEVLGRLDELGGKWLIFGIFIIAGAASMVWGITQSRGNRVAFTTPPTMNNSELNDTLQRALGFTQAELMVNRAGELSENQRTYLAEQFNSSSRWTLVSLFFVVTIVGGIGFYMLTNPDIQEAFDGETVPIIPIILAIVMFVILGSFAWNFNVTAFSDRKRVQMVEGTARLTVTSLGYGEARWISSLVSNTDSMHEMRIGRKRFYLGEQQIKGFWNGGRYRVYYVPISNYLIILSAEAI